MSKIVEEEVVTKTVQKVYVADDGKKFTDKEDFCAHQLKLVKNKDFTEYAKNKIHTVPILIGEDYTGYRPCAYIETAKDYYDFVEYLWAYNVDDCQICSNLKYVAALKSGEYGWSEKYIEEHYIGHWIVFHGDDSGDYYNYDFDDLEDLADEYIREIDARRGALTSMDRFINVPKCYRNGTDEETETHDEV